jgi:hypothetical protein
MIANVANGCARQGVGERFGQYLIYKRRSIYIDASGFGINLERAMTDCCAIEVFELLGVKMIKRIIVHKN